MSWSSKWPGFSLQHPSQSAHKKNQYFTWASQDNSVFCGKYIKFNLL
jgi:hypothetical protein